MRIFPPLHKTIDWAKKRNVEEQNLIEQSITESQRIFSEKQRLEQERFNRELLEKKRIEAERQRLKDEEERRKKELMEKEKKEKERIRLIEEQKHKENEQRRLKQEQIDAKRKEEEAREKRMKETFKDDPEEDSNMAWSIIHKIKTEVVAPISEKKELKNYCFTQKRKITPRLGQITKSNSQIMKITQLLQQTFQEARNTDPLVYKWVLNFFCKSVVKQAEAEVAVNPISAYPLAKVCLLLQTQNADLKDLLFARLQKNCPWVIPFWYDHGTENGKKKMGFKKLSDGHWEQNTTYNERQCGIFAVYAAILSLDDSLAPESWRTFSRLLNLPSPSQLMKSDLELGQTLCSIVSTYLDIAGQSLLRIYGRQAKKLIVCSFSEAYLGANGGGSQYGRLRIVGEDWMKGQGGLKFSFEP